LRRPSPSRRDFPAAHSGGPKFGRICRTLPDCLTRAFAEDPLKVQHSPASVQTKPGPLTKVVDDLAISLMPHAHPARMLQDQDK
jgi:hypothetical protein